MGRSLRRVTIAVDDLASALDFYGGALGLPRTSEADLLASHLHTVGFRIGDVEIELLHPTDDDTAVARYIERKGSGLHHIAIEVEDLDGEMQTLRTRGVALLDSEPRLGPHGRMAFIDPRSTGGVLIELNEAPRSTPATGGEA